MRKAVTFLQSSHQLSGGAPVSMKMVTDIGGQVCNDDTHGVDTQEGRIL